MAIDFAGLFGDESDLPLDPREIFLTLDKSDRFGFLRDIQADVLDAWFQEREKQDLTVKLNVGSGKTLVGLLILQSSLNEGAGPAVFITPDKFLAEQVIEEAKSLGISVCDSERDSGFLSGAKILVVNVKKLFNGRSTFGVGLEGRKIEIGSIVIDDAHACLGQISDQFKVVLPNTSPVYSWALNRYQEGLKQQSLPSFLSLKDGDPQYALEVPFWTVQEHASDLAEVLHKHRNDEGLLFTYPLIANVLPLCRIVMSGQSIEIAPAFPPSDQINSFRGAKRRIYMTATLSDDSVLVTHFGANASKLTEPLTAASSQAMGERMILMPQELNPDFSLIDLQTLCKDVSLTDNVVVIVPSTKSAAKWQDIANQTLVGDQVSIGVAKLRKSHVGLTVLVNRYDGIDLPKAACRLLVIVGLPEASGLIEQRDAVVLGNSAVTLRRQIQRIEQGMGRGVRSSDDYCAVILYDARLTQRILSPGGKAMLTPATRAQLELSTLMAKQIQGADVSVVRSVIGQCLGRDKGWIAASKKALLKAGKTGHLQLDPTRVLLRQSFDEARAGDHRRAAQLIQPMANDCEDQELKAWLKVRLAELTNFFDRSAAQEILQAAHRGNPTVLRALEGVAYAKISPIKAAQAAAVQLYLTTRFLDMPQRLLFAQGLKEALVFEPETSERFEAAFMDAGALIGIRSQRPEAHFGEGPDNLWVLRDNSFVVIECKNGATTEQGISKVDLGQLGQAVDWFEQKYGVDQPKVPLIVHPLSKLGPKASATQGLRVMDKDGLERFRSAIYNFTKSVSDPDTVNDVANINKALVSFDLTEARLLPAYTKPL